MSLENFVIVMHALSLHKVLHQPAFFKMLSGPRLSNKFGKEKTNIIWNPFSIARISLPTGFLKDAGVDVLHSPVTNATLVGWKSCSFHVPSFNFFLKNYNNRKFFTRQAQACTQLCLIMTEISIMKKSQLETDRGHW